MNCTLQVISGAPFLGPQHQIGEEMFSDGPEQISNEQPFFFLHFSSLPHTLPPVFFFFPPFFFSFLSSLPSIPVTLSFSLPSCPSSLPYSLSFLLGFKARYKFIPCTFPSLIREATPGLKVQEPSKKLSQSFTGKGKQLFENCGFYNERSLENL